jgi:predicted TIM-barrel fold metal-dependent hydrolase
MEYTLVSADSHLSLPPGFFQRYLPDQYRDHDWVRMIEGMRKEALKMAGMGLAHMAGRKYEDYKEKDISEDDIKPAAFEPAARLEAMDVDGVDAEVLISGGVVPNGDGITADFQRAVMQAYNNFISEFCSTAPKRLIGPATIPLQNMELAVEEAERARRMAGIRAFLLEAFPQVPYWDAQYEPLWRIADSNGIPIHIHIAQPRSTTVDMSSLKPGQGTAETFISLAPSGLMETLAILVFSGVMQRYPNITFVMTEAGASWLVYFRERADVVHKRHRHWTKSELTEPPSYYIDRQVMNTFIEDQAAVKLRHEVGLGNMMWSTDFPHSDSTWPHSREYIEEVFADVPEKERYQIIAGNAVKLYGL